MLYWWLITRLLSLLEGDEKETSLVKRVKTVRTDFAKMISFSVVTSVFVF